MSDVVLCLGSNLGDRASYLRQMESELERVLQPPVKKSRLMETEPLGVTAAHPWYYNRLVRGNYDGTPRQLLKTCQRIEKDLGRTRPEKYAPRTADIDILLFGNQAINEKDLIIPHRHILDRKFCLEGLAEIAGEWIVPGLLKPVDTLMKEMTAVVKSQKIKKPANG
jgi:2-amino-4-hydroxy-6-hydroxymethyldihydropteridine diphosphokinase